MQPDSDFTKWLARRHRWLLVEAFGVQMAAQAVLDHFAQDGVRDGLRAWFGNQSRRMMSQAVTADSNEKKAAAFAEAAAQWKILDSLEKLPEWLQGEHKEFLKQVKNLHEEEEERNL